MSTFSPVSVLCAAAPPGKRSDSEHLPGKFRVKAQVSSLTAGLLEVYLFCPAEGRRLRPSRADSLSIEVGVAACAVTGNGIEAYSALQQPITIEKYF